MQHFISNLLAQRRVAKLLVVNGTTVRVVLTEPAFGGDEAAAADGGSSPEMSELRPAPTAAPASSGAALGEPSYYFTIGSVEPFEEKLEATQAKARRSASWQPR